MGSGYEIARAIEQLISSGHPAELAWSYTPRQLAGWIELSKRRRQGEMAELMSIMAVAMSGDKKAIRESIKRLSDESQ